MRSLAFGAGLVLLAGALAACDVPRPPPPRLWTLFDVQALYADGASETKAIATDAGLPGGVSLGHMVDADGNLFLHPTLTEGYESRYLTTEVWTHYDEVWAQPLYIPVTYSSGGRTPVSGAWIFSVGPGSLFYSPFWQVIYVDLPDAALAAGLRSVRDVLSSGYALHPGPGRTVSLVPPGLSPPTGPIPVAGSGWIDGQPVDYLDFGGATIEWDDDLVVRETPLYVLVYRTATGELKRLGVTTVAASGPRGSNLAQPPLVDDQPRYAAYWRIYLVVIPPPGSSTVPALSVFAPPNGTGLAEQLTTDGFVVAGNDYAPAVRNTLSTDSHALEPYEGRVSVDTPGPNGLPPCFDDPALLAPSQVVAGHCHWLGSQNDIQAYFDASEIIRTAVTVTCPVVMVDGTDLKPVKLK